VTARRKRGIDAVDAGKVLVSSWSEINFIILGVVEILDGVCKEILSAPFTDEHLVNPIKRLHRFPVETQSTRCSSVKRALKISS
jgi:hypothetical protein